jgi:ubiquinone/menaquinone biosynthesis C-methylase UbiE
MARVLDQEAHWNKIGSRYDKEIFDVFKSDRNKILSSYFKRHANKSFHAIDFGCGMGKAFPYLSPAFSKTLAIDISDELLNIARKSPYKNIVYKRADLTSRNLVFPLAEFVFCCNVIMFAEIGRNKAMIQNIHRALRVNGTSLVVVPSLESVLFSSSRLIEWYKREKTDIKDIPASELAYYKGKKDILQGIILIDNVPTKHYLEPELRLLFEEAGLVVTAIDKIEYDWNSEFDSPPPWMRAPYPWDWLVECRKIKQ